MKLKEIKVGPVNGGYAADFFAEVAKQKEGKFFLYEEKTTGNNLRSAAYNYGNQLGKKFSVRVVKQEVEGAEPQEVFVVGIASGAPRKSRRAPSVPAGLNVAVPGGPENVA